VKLFFQLGKDTFIDLAFKNSWSNAVFLLQNVTFVVFDRTVSNPLFDKPAIELLDKFIENNGCFGNILANGKTFLNLESFRKSFIFLNIDVGNCASTHIREICAIAQDILVATYNLHGLVDNRIIEDVYSLFGPK
jgi:nicotinic acid mononucleotide adenylyltransferase